MTTYQDDINAALDEPDVEPIRWRTLAEVSTDPPPDLILGLLEPSQNLLVAPPGTGKGMTGAYLVTELQRAGLRPLIYDAERREGEWARRVGGLGAALDRVGYVTPDDLPRFLRGRPVYDAAEDLHALVVAQGVDIILLDSILPAIGLGEDRIKSDPSVPFDYVDGLRIVGVPAVSFAHPPKGQPDGEAFGSYAWGAAHRLVLGGRRAEGAEHRVRWKFRKANDRGRMPGVLLTFTYCNGALSGVDRADDEESTRDRILFELTRGPLSVTDLVDAFLDDEDDVTDDLSRTTHERIRKALRRMARDGWVDAPPKGQRGGVWALRFRGPA